MDQIDHMVNITHKHTFPLVKEPAEPVCVSDNPGQAAWMA